MITTSFALTLAATCPLRPTVTRWSGRLIVPSTLPSTKSDSEPLISPLITSVRPIVACSSGAPTVLTGTYEFWLGACFWVSGDCNMCDLPCPSAHPERLGLWAYGPPRLLHGGTWECRLRRGVYGRARLREVKTYASSNAPLSSSHSNINPCNSCLKSANPLVCR